MDLKYRCQVTKHQFTSYRQHDDAEKLTNNIECSIAEVFREPVGTNQDQV